LLIPKRRRRWPAKADPANHTKVNRVAGTRLPAAQTTESPGCPGVAVAAVAPALVNRPAKIGRLAKNKSAVDDRDAGIASPFSHHRVFADQTAAAKRLREQRRQRHSPKKKQQRFAPGRSFYLKSSKDSLHPGAGVCGPPAAVQAPPRVLFESPRCINLVLARTVPAARKSDAHAIAR